MIDSLKLLIPLETDKLEILKSNFKRFRKDDLKTGEIEFEFFSNNIKIGPYNRTISIKETKVPLGIFVEFSIPKYKKGNNVEMIYPHELLKIMTEFYNDLCSKLNYSFPPFSSWIIYRLDICYNWMMKNKEEAKYAMDFLQRIDFPRKKKSTYDTSIMYIGSAYTVKFYMKGSEFSKNDFKEIESNRATNLQQWANRIVRFEVALRRNYLQDFLGLDKVYIKDIINDSEIIEILKHYLEKKVFFYLNTNSMTDENIKQILYNNFTKTKVLHLYQFYEGYFFNKGTKDMITGGCLNRSTIYRYKKDLKRVGIGISIDKSPETKNIIEKLVIPSSDSKFDLLDYPLSEV